IQVHGMLIFIPLIEISFCDEFESVNCHAMSLLPSVTFDENIIGLAFALQIPQHHTPHQSVEPGLITFRPLLG
ncbi:MAG: hypothetical protein ACRD28_08150, partial [Acidobacteriaceae bacterium]